MPKKKKVRFEVQLDVEDNTALAALEKRSKLNRVEIVRRLIRRANASEVVV